MGNTKRGPKNPAPQEWLSEELSQDYIADYKPFNFVDGEGVRCSLYVSGCLFACPVVTTELPRILNMAGPTPKNWRTKSLMILANRMFKV
mgnify:CR=1 FL=1